MIPSPLISVIVPVYKVEPYLRRCVDSILSQTFSNFELILIDDGSPDNCGKICDEYAQKDSRIFVIHQENKGVSAARNAGIEWSFENSDSQWLTFIDSDDWIHPQYLELLLSATKTHLVDISVCEYEETSAMSSYSQIKSCSYKKMSTEEFYIGDPITAVTPWCKLYKKTCFETIRYPIGKRYEDEFTTYKVLFEKSHISYLNEKLYFYYTNHSGFIKSEWSPIRLDAITALKEQVSFFRKNGYSRALKSVEKNLLWNIVKQIETIKNSDKYASYTPKLKRILRSCLRDYKKDLNLSLKNNSDLYVKAYPKLTKLYWFVSYELSKLKFTRR